MDYKTLYKQIVLKEKARVEKEKENCSHPLWIKKCSCCGKILETDKQKND